jgi:Flp pilus assembly protein TadG
MNRRGIWPGLKHKTEGCPNLGRNLLQTFLHDASAFSVGLRSSKLGQVLVLVALARVALIGFVALAVDVGFIWGARRKMQTAADAAATAGAIASRQGQSSANITAAATGVAGLNGFSSGLSVNPSYSGGGCSANCVQVTITQNQPTYFLGALGFANISVGATAVAGTTNSGSCIYGLGPTSPAFDAHGNATVGSSGGTTNFCDDYSSLSGGASPIESTTLYQ